MTQAKSRSGQGGDEDAIYPLPQSQLSLLQGKGPAALVSKVELLQRTCEWTSHFALSVPILPAQLFGEYLQGDLPPETP